MPEKFKENNFTSIIITVWALILISAFLFPRSDDICQLPALVDNLAGKTFFGLAGFLTNLFGVLIACLIVAAWCGLGSLMVLAVKRISTAQTDDNDSKILGFARSCGFGAAGWSLLWFFAGLSGGYKPATAAVSLLIGLTLFIYFAFRSWQARKSLGETNSTDVVEKLAFGITVIIILLTLISAVAPPTAKDALLYHFAVPRNFISAGNNQVIEGNIASYLALGTEMQVVWAMLLGNIFSLRTGEAAASATVFAFFPLLALATYGWARELGLDKKWAIISALLFVTIPTAYHVASSGYIDLALAFYLTLAVHAVSRWWKDLRSEWLFYTALCLGAALAIKLTALFAVIAVALAILLRARLAQNDETRNSPTAISLLAKGLIALACAGILASPWYIRDWVQTGSPVFPFYLNVWNGAAPGWDAKRSVWFQVINSQYGGSAKSIIDYLIAPVAVSLRAQPELPQYFDGVLGVVFLFGLPLIIWAYRRSLLDSSIKIALLISGCLFVFWLFTSQQLRYLLPIFPTLAVVIVFSSYALTQDKKVLRQTLGIALLIISIISGSTSLAWFAQKSPLQVVFGGESTEDFLTRSLDYYPYYQIINTQFPENSKIWLINMRRDTYYLNRPYFSDYMFEDYTFKKLVEESKNTAELQSKIKQLGITHLLVRHDFLLDYKQSVLVDDALPGKANLEKLNLARGVILDNKNVIRSDNKFSLVEIE